MDLGEWHGCKPSIWSDLLARTAKATALQTGYPLLPRAGHGGQSVHRHRLLLLFRDFQIGLRGGCDPGLATALDVAVWARCDWSGFLLCIHAGSSRQAESF